MSIIQRATITKIENGELHLSICRAEACGACKAQSACASSGGGKEIVVADDGSGREVGDEVVLRVNRSQGVFAVVIAYLVPVVVVVGLLVILQSIGVREIVAGGAALGALVLYFVLIRIFRGRFETELTIEIE